MLWAVHSGCSNGIWMPWLGLRLPASDMLTLKTWRVQMLQNNSRAFDLSTFSVRRPSPIHSYSLPASVCLTLSPHTHRHGEHPLSLFGAHEVPHLKYAFLPPGNARREKREPTYVCVCESVCGVGVENVFWQVSLMRSFYEICKPGNPTPSPHPLLLVCHSTKFEACCWNCNWADCIGMSWVYESMGISMGYRECESVRAEEHGKWKRM